MASSTSSPGSAPAPARPAAAVNEPKRRIGAILSSYFYWTYPRGSFHYDIMVTLILLFIFVTPHLWDYGVRPTSISASRHPLEVVAAGRGVIITIRASDLNLAPGTSYSEAKKALRQAIEPVTGDDVFVERWETVTDTQGNLAWKVWAHR